MELIRVKPRKIIKLQIDNEGSPEDSEHFSRDFDNFKDYIRTLLLDGDTLKFNKLLLQEFVQEVVDYGKHESLVKELETIMKDSIEKLLMQIDDKPFDPEKQDLIDMALKCVNTSKADDVPQNYWLYSKFEFFWCKIRLALSEMIQICEPLENGVFNSNSRYILLDKAISYFKTDKEERMELYETLQAAILEQIHLYRIGKKINFCQLRNIMEMLKCIELYDSIETKILNKTSEHYRSLVGTFLEKYTHPECYRLFQESIAFEKSSAVQYLTDASVKRVMSVVMQELLYTHATEIMNTNILKSLICGKDIDSIKLLRSLYVKSAFEDLFYNSIMASAKDMCNDSILLFLKDKNYTDVDNCHNEFILELYNCQKTMDTIIHPIMTNSHDYNNRIKALWTALLNDGDDRVEFITIALAKHADDMSVKLTTEKFMRCKTSKLEFILHLFRFIENKSYFELCYRNFISMRLLYDQHITENHIFTIAKFKDECGVNYSSKLEDIISDVKTSESLQVDFKEQYLANHGVDRKRADKIIKNVQKYNFSILLISMDGWIYKKIFERTVEPTDESFIDSEIEQKQLQLPDLDADALVGNDTSIDDINEIQLQFREFYVGKFKNKSLMFLPEFGSVIISCKYPTINGSKTYELELSTLQAYCLLLFNNKDAMNLKEFDDLIPGYDEIVMRKHLGVLNHLPEPLVVFYDKSLNFDTCIKSDYFTLNKNFYSENETIDCRYKSKELFSKDLSFSNKRGTFEDMLPFIESTIVRYLKQTIEASSTTLFKMCCKNAQYTISRDQFNKVIDSLVNREFIKFNASNKEFVQYIP